MSSCPGMRGAVLTCVLASGPLHVQHTGDVSDDGIAFKQGTGGAAELTSSTSAASISIWQLHIHPDIPNHPTFRGNISTYGGPSEMN